VSGSLSFAKYHGAGNDFVMIVDLDDERPVSPELAASLCDRRRGIGADGVIRVVRTGRDDAPFFMDYRNADGSVAEMCGNGIRCVGALLRDRGLIEASELDVLTRAGAKSLVLHHEPRNGVTRVTVSMGTP
jgi:diaminopimelate epimerase